MSDPSVPECEYALELDTKMVEKLMGTDAKLDLLRVFNSSPASGQTLEELASKTGRGVSEIQLAVVDFVDLSIVKRQEVYSLCIENYRELQEAISRRMRSLP